MSPRGWLAALALALLLVGIGPVAVAAAPAPEAVAPPFEVGAGGDVGVEVGPAQAGWEQIALEGATCGRGAPYRYYLNAADDPDAGLLFFLNGGGACLKEGPPPPDARGGIARGLHCMAYDNFEDPLDTLARVSLLGVAFPHFRRLPGSPFADHHWVFLPYCTGDVHVGRMTVPYDYDPTADGTFDVLHRGRLNVLAVMDDVAARLPGADRPVVLTGVSAGGFGAIFNFPAFVARWPDTVLLPDSGIAPPHPASLMARQGEQVAARWGARAALPDYCATDDCLQDTMHLLAAHADHHDGGQAPWRPFGFLQAQRDATLTEYLELNACGYQLGLRRGMQLAEEHANLRAFVPAGDRHVLSGVPAGLSVDGVAVADWLVEVAGATSAETLPASVVEPWAACNALSLPWLRLGGRPSS